MGTWMLLPDDMGEQELLDTAEHQRQDAHPYAARNDSPYAARDVIRVTRLSVRPIRIADGVREAVARYAMRHTSSVPDLRAYVVRDGSGSAQSGELLLTPQGFANVASELPPGWVCARLEEDQ